MHDHVVLRLQYHERLPALIKDLHPPLLNNPLPVGITRDHSLGLPIQPFIVLEELEMPAVHRESSSNMCHLRIVADLPCLARRQWLAYAVRIRHVRRQKAIAGDDYAAQRVITVGLRDQLLVWAGAVEDLEGDGFPCAGELVAIFVPAILRHCESRREF